MALFDTLQKKLKENGFDFYTSGDGSGEIDFTTATKFKFRVKVQNIEDDAEIQDAIEAEYTKFDPLTWFDDMMQAREDGVKGIPGPSRLLEEVQEIFEKLDELYVAAYGLEEM